MNNRLSFASDTIYMKKLFLAAILATLTFTASAKPEWLTDFEKAKELAQKENKAVLLDFTGSDWCGFCIKLKKQVFNTTEFQTFAEKNLVLVEVDFPSKKLPAEQAKANDKLKDKFNVEGYPTIIVVDAAGKKLGEEVGYSGEPPAAYIKKLEAFLAKKK